jgi:uncharacterized repeat protein (TIGR03803 family)
MKQKTYTLGRPKWGNPVHGVFVLCAMTATALSAQTFDTVLTFNGTDGTFPVAGLVQGTNGAFYGTTSQGGAHSHGTVFSMTPTGTLTTLYSFCSQGSFPTCTDGDEPYAGLLLATNGAFYGTTYGGGAGNCGSVLSPTGCGTIFKITPTGALTTLYTFCAESGCKDGAQPQAGLIQAANGDLYGTTVYGGANGNYGTVFKITPAGALTTIYSFCSQSACADGELPEAGLIQASSGSLYGTTLGGGVHGSYGTVFSISTSGALSTLYSFCSLSNCTDGEGPKSALVQGSNGDLYGTTFGGGAALGGTFFSITTAGALTTLYSFCSLNNCADGDQPEAPLVQAVNGDFYGTTFGGGVNGAAYGTVFTITPSGALTTLYSFCSQRNCTDGVQPEAGLLLSTNGEFYGTTPSEGSDNDGTVFSVSLGLGPFVKTLPASGKTGAVVTILGNNLTGSTAVSFNGTSAAFKVVSSSEIVTKVPAGATSGTVRVVTPTGTLSSNTAFRVL